MNPPRHTVPTLTEVVQLSVGLPPAAPDEAPAAVVDDAPAAGRTAPDDAEIVARVLSDVQRQIDPILEYRLREALAPALARLTEALVQEARDELACTLREVVERAVAQELARRGLR